MVEQIKKLRELTSAPLKDCKEALEKTKVAFPLFGPFDDFEKAVKKAYQLAGKEEVVLLSPGAASFGMFKNEFDRGEKFNQLIINYFF